MRHLFPGHFEAVWKDSLNLSLEASADGKLAGRTWFASDKGTWSLRGNILCITFGGWSKAKCGPVRERGGWYISLMRPDGTPRLKFRRRQSVSRRMGKARRARPASLINVTCPFAMRRGT